MTDLPHEDRPNDDLPGPLPSVDEVTCPRCTSENVQPIGEAFDDDVYLGTSYDCLDCHYRFVMEDDDGDMP